MLVLVIGDSGNGKTSSFRYLPHDETLIIQCVDKDLPFRGARKKYNKDNKNFKVAQGYDSIYTSINKIMEGDTGIENLIIDDMNYLMTGTFVDRAGEKTYDKFTDMAVEYYRLIEALKPLGRKINVFCLSHINHKDNGYMKPMTIGKMSDEKICVEGLFTEVIRAVNKDGDFKLQVHAGSEREIVKTPLGMFNQNFIPNDIRYYIRAWEQHQFADIDDEEIPELEDLD